MTGLHVWHFFDISFYLVGSIPIRILKLSIYMFLGSCLGVLLCFERCRKRDKIKKYVNTVTLEKNTQIQQPFLHFFFWMVLLVTATFLLKTKLWKFFQVDTTGIFWTFVRKLPLMSSFQHPLLHSMAAFSRGFWAPYPSWTGITAHGQALDWDQTDIASPQALRANVSPRMFLRQWFYFPLS